MRSYGAKAQKMLRQQKMPKKKWNLTDEAEEDLGEKYLEPKVNHLINAF